MKVSSLLRSWSKKELARLSLDTPWYTSWTLSELDSAVRFYNVGTPYSALYSADYREVFEREAMA